MSDFIDRLERELLRAGRQAQAHPRTRPHQRLPVRLSGAMASAACAAIAIAVAAVALAGHTSKHDHAATQPNRIPAWALTTRGVRQVGVCNDGRRVTFVKPVDFTAATPPYALRSLAVFKTASPADLSGGQRRFDPSPWGVVRVYTRYVRAIDGPHHSRVTLIPSVACTPPQAGRTLSQAPITPHLGLLMQITGPKFTYPTRVATVWVGTPAMIQHAVTDPGIGDSARRWLQATVVPNRVSRVKLTFTPPYRDRYSRTLTIHDNVGIAYPLPPDVPTIITWYATSGQVIRRFVEHSELRYDQCLNHQAHARHQDRRFDRSARRDPRCR